VRGPRGLRVLDRIDDLPSIARLVRDCHSATRTVTPRRHWPPLHLSICALGSRGLRSYRNWPKSLGGAIAISARKRCESEGNLLEKLEFSDWLPWYVAPSSSPSSSGFAPRAEGLLAPTMKMTARIAGLKQRSGRAGFCKLQYRLRR